MPAIDGLLQAISRSFATMKSYLWENCINSPPAFVTNIKEFFRNHCNTSRCSCSCCYCYCCCGPKHSKRKKSIENIERIINEKSIAAVNHTALIEYDCDWDGKVEGGMAVKTPVLSLDIIDEV